VAIHGGNIPQCVLFLCRVCKHLMYDILVARVNVGLIYVAIMQHLILCVMVHRIINHRISWSTGHDCVVIHQI